MTTWMNKPYWCHVYDRFGSCGWDFATWEDAIRYARDQYWHNVKRVGEYPTYIGILQDYRATITGPDGVNITIWHEYFGRP